MVRAPFCRDVANGQRRAGLQKLGCVSPFPSTRDGGSKSWFRCQFRPLLPRARFSWVGNCYCSTEEISVITVPVKIWWVLRGHSSRRVF